MVPLFTIFWLRNETHTHARVVLGFVSRFKIQDLIVLDQILRSDIAEPSHDRHSGEIISGNLCDTEDLSKAGQISLVYLIADNSRPIKIRFLNRDLFDNLQSKRKYSSCLLRR